MVFLLPIVALRVSRLYQSTNRHGSGEPGLSLSLALIMHSPCVSSPEDAQVSLLYKHTKFPDNPELVQNIATAAASLHEKLARLDLDRTDISAYSRNFMRRYQRKLHANLQKFS